MEEIKWSNEMRNRSRSPALVIVDGENVRVFEGKSVPGKVAVKSSRYHKNGKWSGTDYVLVAADRVALVDFCTPFEGWGATWDDLEISLKPLCGEVDRAWLIRELAATKARPGSGFARAVESAEENEAAMASVSPPDTIKTVVVTVVVTRHPGALEWLQKHHPNLGEAEVVSHATPEQIMGARVVGVLPVNLAALCGEYWHLSMEVPPEARGKELTCEDMERFGCSIERFVIRRA